MNTMTLRTPTSFRLSNTLLEELKAKAKASNRSLNDYVESLLMRTLHPIVASDGSTISPELQARIENAREEHRSGNFVRCSNSEELHNFLDSL